MLDALGMIWSVPDYLWERNYAAAMDYYRKFGKLDVPVRYTAENGVKLGQWLSTLRRLRNTGSAMFNLSDEQIERLNAVGMCRENRYEHNWARCGGSTRSSGIYKSRRIMCCRTEEKSGTGLRCRDAVAARGD